MQIVIDIPEEDYIRLRDEGMFGNVTTFKRAVREGIPLGDCEPCTDAISRFEGMTNGEVMQAVFPKAEVSRYIDEYERPSDYLMYIDDETYFTKDWWNAPYKGGAE